MARELFGGCNIKVQGDQLVVGPGMIKYNQFICLMMEEHRIHYEPAEQIQYLKARIEIDRRSPDYIAFQIELILDLEESEKENEFKLCRFNLRSGAQLRDHYKNFRDMDTEYDTINLIHADWGGLGGKSFSLTVIRYFAQSILESERSVPDNCLFAYLCLSQTSAISLSVLTEYIRRKTEVCLSREKEKINFYKIMCAIIKELEQGGETRQKSAKGRHQILVD